MPRRGASKNSLHNNLSQRLTKEQEEEMALFLCIQSQHMQPESSQGTSALLPPSQQDRYMPRRGQRQSSKNAIKTMNLVLAQEEYNSETDNPQPEQQQHCKRRALLESGEKILKENQQKIEKNHEEISELRSKIKTLEQYFKLRIEQSFKLREGSNNSLQASSFGQGDTPDTAQHSDDAEDGQGGNSVASGGYTDTTGSSSYAMEVDNATGNQSNISIAEEDIIIVEFDLSKTPLDFDRDTYEYNKEGESYADIVWDDIGDASKSVHNELIESNIGLVEVTGSC